MVDDDEKVATLSPEWSPACSGASCLKIRKPWEDLVVVVLFV